MMNDIMKTITEQTLKMKEEMIFYKLNMAREKADQMKKYDLALILNSLIDAYRKNKNVADLKAIMESSKHYEFILEEQHPTLHAGSIDTHANQDKLVFTVTQDFSQMKLIIKEKLLEV